MCEGAGQEGKEEHVYVWGILCVAFVRAVCSKECAAQREKRTALLIYARVLNSKVGEEEKRKEL